MGRAVEAVNRPVPTGGDDDEVGAVVEDIGGAEVSAADEIHVGQLVGGSAVVDPAHSPRPGSVGSVDSAPSRR